MDDSKKIVIVSIAPPQPTEGGDFVYRLKQPYEALGSLPGVTSIAVTNVISSREFLLRNADILVIHLLGDRDLIPIVYERKKAGLPTIFEISDNFLNFQPGNPATPYYEVPDNRACLLKLVSIADAVQTSTEPLAEIFARYNPNIKTFVNQMVSAGTPEREEGFVTVGWGGSSGHFEDITEIAPHIIEWVLSRDDIKFSLMAGENFKSLFDVLPSSKFSWIPPGTIQQYYDFVQSLDIGIAPIRDDEFNRCRSDVKFMEYASRGVVPICTNAPTYSRTLRDGETGFLFNSTRELISILERLTGDIDLRRNVSRNAFDYIKNERSEDFAAGKKLEFYKELLKKTRPESRGNIKDNYVQSNKSLKNIGPGSFYMHMPAESEKLCHKGMIQHFAAGKVAEGAACYQKALELCPDFYLARLCSAMTMTKHPGKAIIEFEKAVALQPELFEAEVWKLRMMNSVENSEEVSGAAQRLVEKFPYMAEAHMLLAELKSAMGDDVATLECLENAVASNTWHMHSAVVLGRYLTGMGTPEKAVELLSEIVELYPNQESPLLVIGEALFLCGRYAESVECYIRIMKFKELSETDQKAALKAIKEIYKRKDYVTALALIKEVSQLVSESREISFWMNRIAERVGTPGA